MKKLSELKISPAPWYAKNIFGHRVFNHAEIEICDSDGVYSSADACLIAAAPDMYECLREAVEFTCDNCTFFDDDKGECTEGVCPWVKRWRAALAKAAGEEAAK